MGNRAPPSGWRQLLDYRDDVGFRMLNLHAGALPNALRSTFLALAIMTRAAAPCITLGDPLSEQSPHPALPLKARRWSIIAAGLLLLALALVVLYTTRAAFYSPLALVVVGAIGFAALLLQLRLRKDSLPQAHAPLWLNLLALLFAAAALLSDVLHLSPAWMLASALAAVICFAISGIVVLRELRRR
jgi:hypothetical protein